MIKVTCVCLDKNHVTEWISSPLINQTSSHPVGEINIVMATYILTCGLHIKQVSLKNICAEILNMPFINVDAGILHTSESSVLC